MQTIPSLALLALFYPLLLEVSALTKAAFGFTVPSLGFLPSLLALTLYSMLPILRNGVAGPDRRRSGDRRSRARRRHDRSPAPVPGRAAAGGAGDHGRGCAPRRSGPSARPPWRRRSGQTSLGNYIFSGLQTENWVYVLFGCAASAALAMAADQLLA
ncbi:MAG: hypothetical protein WDM85_03125 [Caulobacteraceae bacterium]